MNSDRNVHTLFQSRNRETYDSNSRHQYRGGEFLCRFNLVIEKLMIPTPVWKQRHNHP